jgi:hypothetical protein
MKTRAAFAAKQRVGKSKRLAEIPASPEFYRMLSITSVQ